MIANLGTTLNGIENLAFGAIDPSILAGKAFEQAYNRGRRDQLWARLIGRTRQLELLASQPVESHRSASRIVSVPIRQIKGTLGRSTDFDLDFNPLKQYCRTRWISILTAILRGSSMPPVELLQVGASYYVRDGHHRISVAKAIGQQAIDACLVN
ncbi:MAG: hypothetical protein C3F13_18440 [Anaerolineales bacterium]|nr:hypothetical protein [Anaerolineae bacterium]PWB49818.1 MAG: hypothetical protein C3F13_18440 [Anaerolineales bacterium]